MSSTPPAATTCCWPDVLQTFVDATAERGDRLVSAGEDHKRDDELGIPEFAYPHQRVALRKLLGFPELMHRSILAFEMGGGKTLIALACLPRTVSSSSSMVVCPSALKANWEAECKRFRPDLSPVVAKSSKHLAKLVANEQSDPCGHRRLLILSYSLLSRACNLKLMCAPDRAAPAWVIADECHYLKHPRSLRSRALHHVLCKRFPAARALLMSGTPAHSHEHLWPLLKLCRPLVFGKFHHHQPGHRRQHRGEFYFADWFCEAERVAIPGRPVFFKFKRNRDPAGLWSVISRFVLTGYLRDFAPDLPDHVRKTVVIAALGPQKTRFYTKGLADVERLRSTEGHHAAQDRMRALVKQNHHDRERFVDARFRLLVDREAANDHKSIVFAHHRSTLDQLATMVAEHDPGHESVVIHGSVPMKDRHGLVQQFKTDPRCKWAILSLTACGTGLNFQFVSRVFYAEIIFDAVVMVQSEARAHRIGSRTTTVQETWVVDGGLDRMMLAATDHKRDNQSSTLDHAGPCSQNE